MELQTLQALLAADDYEKLKTAIMTEKALLFRAGYPTEAGNHVYDLLHLTQYRKQYEIHGHDVMDKTKRPDKQLTAETGPTTASVSRLPVPLQKMIVNRAASFLCGNPIELDASPKDTLEKSLLSVVQKTWDDNKLDYEAKRLAKLMMSETECAELWYVEKASDGYWDETDNKGSLFRLRMKVLAHSLGDLLYPIFDSSGDMIAFGRCYMMADGNKINEHFDIYTDTKTYYADNSNGRLSASKEEANGLGKIPVIYYWQHFPEWHDVQKLIDRYEVFLSNHADTNDYNGSPTIKVNGKVTGFSKKGEQGKIIEIEEGGDAEYLAWNQATASLELEAKNLRSLIFDMTDTPDISIEQMKAIGTFSGIALKLLFLNAHLKAADKEETFGKGIQRRINLLKASMAKINGKLAKATVMNIKPKFEYYLPKDNKEAIDALTTAVTGGIMSKETAIKQNPLVENADQELTLIDAESQATPKVNAQFN